MISTDKITIGTGVLTSTGQYLYINDQPVGTTFSKSTTFYNPVGISTGSYNFPIWRATSNCRITGIHGYLTSGVSTGVINARKNKDTSHLITNLTIPQTGAWISSGIIQNSDYIMGDILEAQIITVSGLPLTFSIQVDFINR